MDEVALTLKENAVDYPLLSSERSTELTINTVELIQAGSEMLTELPTTIVRTEIASKARYLILVYGLGYEYKADMIATRARMWGQRKTDPDPGPYMSHFVRLNLTVYHISTNTPVYHIRFEESDDVFVDAIRDLVEDMVDEIVEEID